MMLRTTISRIKKVCTVAFVPRLLRGEQRCAPGKFEIFSYAVLRKAPKSTKSTDEGEHATTDKHNDGAEFMFASREEPKLEGKSRKDEAANLGDEMSEENSKLLVSTRVPLKETQYEKCQRIIDQAFGKEEIMEPMLGEQYFSHKVNIEETRREINESEMAAKLKIAEDKQLTDDRTHVGVFKMSRELLTDDLTEEPDDVMIKKSMIKVTPKKGGAKTDETTEDLDFLKPLHINLSTKEPVLLTIPENVQAIINDSLPPKKTIARKEVDVRNQQRIENRAVRDVQEHKPIINDNVERKKHRVATGSVNKFSHERKDHLYQKLKGQLPPAAKVDTYIQNKEKIQKAFNSFKPRRNNILHHTTATQNEEQLTQRLEHIDETPLVEAQKPNIEGFNVTPRVLGDQEPVLKCFSGKTKDRNCNPSTANVPTNLDEVAKRCLDSPVGKIDEILLNEMEKFGIPVTCNSKSQPPSPVIEDDLVQMDELKKQPKGNIEKKEIDSENTVYEKNTVELCSSSTLYPSRHMNETKLPELDEQTKKVAKGITEPEEELILHTSQIHIDLHDKKPLPCDTVQYTPAKTYDPITKKFTTFFMPPLKQSAETNKEEIANVPLLVNPNMKEVTNKLMSEKILNDAQVDEMTKNIITEASPIQTYSPIIREVTSNVITEVPKSGPKNIKEITNNLIAELSSLKEPLTEENVGEYLTTEQKTNENAQQFIKAAPVDAEKSPKVSFEQSRNYTSNNIRQEKYLKPDYRYSQRNFVKGIEKPSYYERMDASNNTWNEQQSQPKSEYKYSQKTDTREIDKQPPYYQTMHWYLQSSEEPKPEEIYAQAYNKEMDKQQPYIPYIQQNYQHEENKYGHNICGTEADKKSFYTADMSAAYMWGHHHVAPGIKPVQNIEEADAKETNEMFSPQPNSQTEYTKVEQADLKPTQSTGKKRSYERIPYDHFRVPDGIWDKKVTFQPNTSNITASLSCNKTNLNVSDDIWDEHLDSTEILQPKPKQEPVKINLPDEILNQQLDPYYVLTCNETCPISPKPSLSASETSRLVNTTEAIYEKDFNDAEPVCPKDSRLLIEFDTNLSPDPQPKGDEANLQHMSKIKPASIPDALSSLPTLSEDLSLTELLRRVRERSRIIECRNELKALGLEVEPAQCKCPRKAPRCPPTAPRSPPNNPVAPPSFGLPMLKPRPPACKSKKKPQTRKFSTCDIDLSPGVQLGPKINARAVEICPEMVCEMNDTGAGLYATSSRADLTEEVIDRLQTLGKILDGVLHQGKSHLLDVGSLFRNRRGFKTVLARDYEPWAPIPSWPAPKKPERKKPPCAPGCPIFPPPRASVTPDPPCGDLKPCEGSPKRTFSLLDCFAVSLGENKVYDLGEF